MQKQRTRDLTREEFEHLDYCESWIVLPGSSPPTGADWDRYRELMGVIGLDPEPFIRQHRLCRRYSDLTVGELNHIEFCESWHEGHRRPGPTAEDWDRYERIMTSMGISLETEPKLEPPSITLPWELPRELSTIA